MRLSSILSKIPDYRPRFQISLRDFKCFVLDSSQCWTSRSKVDFSLPFQKVFKIVCGWEVKFHYSLWLKSVYTSFIQIIIQHQVFHFQHPQETQKDLDVVVSSDSKWSNHCNSIIKAYKSLALIWCTFSSSHFPSVKLHLYITLVVLTWHTAHNYGNHIYQGYSVSWAYPMSGD